MYYMVCLYRDTSWFLNTSEQPHSVGQKHRYVGTSVTADSSPPPENENNTSTLFDHIFRRAARITDVPLYWGTATTIGQLNMTDVTDMHANSEKHPDQWMF